MIDVNLDYSEFFLQVFVNQNVQQEHTNRELIATIVQFLIVMTVFISQWTEEIDAKFVFQGKLETLIRQFAMTRQIVTLFLAIEYLEDLQLRLWKGFMIRSLTKLVMLAELQIVSILKQLII